VSLFVCLVHRRAHPPLHAVRGEAEYFSTRLNDAAAHVWWVRARDQAVERAIRLHVLLQKLSTWSITCGQTGAQTEIVRALQFAD